MLQIGNETQQFYRYSKLNLLKGVKRPIKQEIYSHNKRAPEDETLVEATLKGDYTYWLSQEDIADIARIEYNAFQGGMSNAYFEILGSLAQLYITAESFQLKVQAYQLSIARHTLIINLENLHWVTLVISYQHGNYIAYYVDSKNNPMPAQYSQMLIKDFQIQPFSLSPGLTQQKDDYNCGIWALENAADLSQMIDQNESLHSIVNELNRPRGKEYFDIMRVFFSEKLRNDPIWLERHPSFLTNLRKKLERSSHDVRSSIDKLEPASKRFKVFPTDKENLTILLEIFLETFMSTFVKSLSIHHLLAKDKLLTEEAIKTELKTGLTGALVGVSIAESLVGSIPSVVASIRMISNKFYGSSKNKAQKITRAFSILKPDHLDFILAEAAVNIFYCFESQFMQITDKAGDKVAMEKLAEDAVERVLSYIENTSNEENRVISREIIEKGVLKGSSEKFFIPKLKNIKQVRVSAAGYDIQDKHKHNIRTVSLYEKTGLVEFDINNQPMKFYVSKKSPRSRYGYRRLFDWEKEANGELKESVKEEYIEKYFSQSEDELPFISKNYNYVLQNTKTHHTSAEAQRILNKIQNRYASQFIVKQPESKKPIYFNLRKPVKNFSGRVEILERLHNILMSERTTAIVPTWFTLSVSDSSPISPSDSDSSQTSSGSQLSISGLGGIGKTQLALRYAELYAHHYDHNVLYIDAETKENLIYSFQQLALKLKIITKDQYEQKKYLQDIDVIYDYFADKKSLFIFDNVENYHTIESYLPKPTPGNKPTVIITSRYSNWNNIATTLPLSVFTGQEAEELIKNSLEMEDNEYERIMELNQLLQGLPLALQQALAYIKLKKNTDANFSIFHYIELYKKKQQELLKFNFSDYVNDPYLKTVFTTWIITLDKIKSYSIGENALNILNIMAYLSPDSISAKKFYQLIQLNRDLQINDLDEIMNLLCSYSMINPEDNQGKYSIHRLVQQVIRINIEQDSSVFAKTVENTQLFLWHWDYTFKKDKENVFHYLHFLIYMSEHTELVTQLVYGNPEKKFFDGLILQDTKYSQYFIDLAYLKFPKGKFLRFLGDAIAYYIKIGNFPYLSEILNYIENKWDVGIFSKENIKYISEHFINLKNPTLKFSRYSTIPSKKENQRQSLHLFYRFKSKIFGTHWLADNCPSDSLKRSICILSESDEDKIKELRKQPIKAHFKKIEQISRYISSALMTKDTLSALLQGHFDEVAINFGLMTSSLFFGKISNSLLTQGKNLASDASLLEKNLGLENKKVLSILFNENVSAVGKRKFLGKVMQAVSPFAAKATSIYFAYNLKNEIHAYKMGNKDVLPNIISNSVILSIDGIEASIEAAEFLGMIAGISAFTGPLGEGMALVVWLGAEGYAAEQHVEAIEKYVHLSRGEKFFEFLLSTLHLAPLEYIQLKTSNGQLVERAINFLKNNTDIQWSIFPAFHFEADLCKIRKVFLTEKINFTPDDNNPDEPAEGDLICLSASPPPYEALNIKMKYYLCHKTLGVSYALNRTGNGTLVDLGEGEDEVIAFSDSPTLFIVQNGKKRYLGGDNGNVFNLQGNATTGRLQGGKGSDILVLDNFYPENSDYVLLDADGFLCGKNKSLLQSIPPFCSPNEMSIQIDRIDHIYGRRNEPDILYVNKDVRFIDGYGGKNHTHPDNFFITEHAYKNLKFILRNNTLITFLSNPTTDSIEYRIPSGEIGESWIHCYFKETIQHRFFFEYFLHEVDLISIQDNTVHISILVGEDKDKKTFSLSISEVLMTLEVNQTHNAAQRSKNFYYLFKDFEIKLISNGHLYVKEITANNQTLDEKIGLFKTLANRLEETFSIQLFNNITLSIGREKKHEIFYINGAYENHLVGNGGENVYTILANKKIFFPVSNIVLYETSHGDSNELVEQIDTLDLREIIKKYKQSYSNVVISSDVFPSGNDLILTLSNSVYGPVYSNSYDENCFEPWLTIQLKNALFDNSHWYQRLDIFFDILPKNIIPLDDKVWSLITAPLIFTVDKKIIVITSQDIEEDTEIQILKNIGNYAFFRDETNLILTNAFEVSNDYCTIICQNFYQEPEMRKKILSVIFKFYDQEIYPKDYQKKIEHATHFQHLSQIMTRSNLSNILTYTYLNSVGVEGHQTELSQSIVRRKRQVHREEKIIVNTTQSSTSTKKNSKQTNQTFFHDRNHASQTSRIEKENRILAIANDYLEKYDSSLRKKSYRNTKKLNQKKNKNKRKDVFPSVREKDKPNIAKHPLLNQKNNANYFQPITQNYFPSKTLKTLPKFQKEKQFRLPISKTESTNTKDNFFKSPDVDKNKSPYQANKFLPQRNSKKPSTIYSKITYEQRQSDSKKSNGSYLASHINEPNIHNTLIFLDFLVRKSLGNPIVPFSLDKKLNKNIKRAVMQKVKLNSRIHFNSSISGIFN